MTIVIVVSAAGIEQRDVDTTEGVPFVDEIVGAPCTFFGAWDDDVYMLGCRDHARLGSGRAIAEEFLPAQSFRRDPGPFFGRLTFVRMGAGFEPVDYTLNDYEQLRGNHATNVQNANFN